MKPKQALIFFVVFCLVLSSLCLVTSTAWYYNSRKVSGEGLQLKTSVTQNLIIVGENDIDLLKTVKVESTDQFSVTTEAAGSTDTFNPVSHKEGETNGTLYYLVNTDEVDRKTGLIANPQYGTITADKSARFYMDQTVYIASAGSVLTNHTLTASLTGTVGEECLKSASVDFWVASGTFAAMTAAHIGDGTMTYQGTLNIAGLDQAVNDGTTEKTELEIVLPYSPDTEGKYSTMIPMTTGTGTGYKTPGCIKVVMRCYFDGALLKNSKQAYVFTESDEEDAESERNVAIDVLFTAEANS